MKQNLPFHILLAAAILLAGIIAGYNLIFRESYAVEVRYDYPPGGASSWAEESKPASSKTVGQPKSAASETWVTEIVPEYDEFYEEDIPEESPEIVVYFPLELNRVSYNELILIPGIGDVTAQRILQYRDVLGMYENLEQLMDIKGIGQVTYESIAPYLYIEGE